MTATFDFAMQHQHNINEETDVRVNAVCRRPWPIGTACARRRGAHAAIAMASMRTVATAQATALATRMTLHWGMCVVPASASTHGLRAAAHEHGVGGQHHVALELAHAHAHAHALVLCAHAPH